MGAKKVGKLEAQREAILVKGNELTVIDKYNVSPHDVGVKAYGLLALPEVWTLPFFVVNGDSEPSESLIKSALKEAGISGSNILVRSSGVQESLESRGSLDSLESKVSDVLETINLLKNRLNCCFSDVHWVVQELSTCKIKGHLSNERRLSEALRDWVVETEAEGSTPTQIRRISIRKWRDGRDASIEVLSCLYKAQYIDALRWVAVWAHDKSARVHFEWVWNGRNIYIVQADECNTKINGVDPTKITAKIFRDSVVPSFNVFRVAGESDYIKYRKLGNAKIYREIGYSEITFFVLDDQDEIDGILRGGECSEEIKKELFQLTKRPLVIRTDGEDIPESQRQMLPRSNELRSLDAAVKWLSEVFRDKVLELGLEEAKLCLIAHHFIPASSSAWSQAHPDKRRVRIESLWGLPEGLYWYAHDVFDVDTKFISISPKVSKPPKLRVRERLRYKGRFVAPDKDGEWILHETAESHDWTKSIKKSEWVEEIAWMSRCIADRLGKAVVVMWFVDVLDESLKSSVIPWYHEEWKNKGQFPKAAPRKKLSNSEEFNLCTISDWEVLKRQCYSGHVIARVVIDPREPELVRDQQFLRDMSDLAHTYSFVIELSGGLLSHAYYMLTSSGCRVECADLYATDEGELEFNKLVRDKVPEYISAKGEEVKITKLEGEALVAALKRKIVEEALEVLDAETSPEIIEEIADLVEVITALKSVLSISDEEVEEVRDEKAGKRGGFEKGVMLEKTALSSSFNINQDTHLEPMLVEPDEYEKRISTVEKLPGYISDFHTDKRYNASGEYERLFTTHLPAYSDGITPSNVNFTLESSDGSVHSYIFNIGMQRKGADVRVRIRLISAPTQMKLDV